MNWDTFISILKWVALVFVAGLIGYFGKYLGQRIIARFSKNKDADKSKEPLVSPPSSEKKKQDYKLEKKRLKSDKKRLKKQKKS